MPEADVLYSEVKFSKIGEPISSSNESAEGTTLRQKSEPSGLQPAASIRTRERVALLVLCVLMVAVIISLCVTLVGNMTMKKRMECLKLKFKSVKVNLTDELIDEPCLMCDEGWEQHGGRCYYFYTKNSSWTKSREFCQSKGGDLVKIDSREEQIFLNRRVGEIMMENEDKFWIGLTDSETEATWTWVDGSTLDTSLTFWSKREPDNWKGQNSEGEDCVRMGELGGGGKDQKTWFDKSCDKPHRSVCEKPAV